MGVRMSCSRRPLAGSGYVKPENPMLEVQNNCALAALMAAREEQDSALHSMWTGGPTADTTLPPPVHTVPPSDTGFYVDGHFYKVPDVERAEALHKSLTELAEERAKEEAKWAAHWTDPSAATVSVKPAWEDDTGPTQAMITHVDASTKKEFVDDDTDTDIPSLEISELS